MSEPLYQIRKHGEKPGDFAMVDEWRQAHGEGPMIEALLPPDGFIVTRNGDDVFAGWLYLTAGVGVAFMEFITSKPGQTLQQSSAACRHFIEFAKAHARSCDYGVIFCHTIPAIARVAREWGFKSLGIDRVSMVLNTGLGEQK